MIIDTHCHLATSKYTDMDLVVQESLDLGVTHCITQGTHRADWEPQLDLVKRYPEFMSSCLAIHPSDAAEATDEDMEMLRQLCRSNPQAAIGETGLDYYWPAPEGWTEERYHARQHELLVQHFELAQELGLNISLHTRDRKGWACFEDCFAIAKQFPKVRPVFHCFIGTKEQATRIFEELNGMISVTGIVTFKKSDQVQEVFSWAPIDRIMLETDSPFLSPEPCRGQLNIPGRTRYVAEKVAQLRRVSLEEIAEQTTLNAQGFFKL